MNARIIGYDKHKIHFIVDNQSVIFNVDEQTWDCDCNSRVFCDHINEARIRLYEIKNHWERYYRKDLIEEKHPVTKMDKIKEKIFNILDYQDLIYCETVYDSEDDEDGVWLYEFCIYDDEDKINKIENKLNEIKYVGAIALHNEDDDDYTIECTIDLNNPTMSIDDMLKTYYWGEDNDKQ